MGSNFVQLCFFSEGEHWTSTMHAKEKVKGAFHCSGEKCRCFNTEQVS